MIYELLSRPYTMNTDWNAVYGVIWEGMKSKTFKFNESFIREFWQFLPRYDIHKYQDLSEDFKREMKPLDERFFEDLLK